MEIHDLPRGQLACAPLQLGGIVLSAEFNPAGNRLVTVPLEAVDGLAVLADGMRGIRGEVRRATRSMFGQFVSVSPCPTCAGARAF